MYKRRMVLGRDTVRERERNRKETDRDRQRPNNIQTDMETFGFRVDTVRQIRVDKHEIEIIMGPLQTDKGRLTHGYARGHTGRHKDAETLKETEIHKTQTEMKVGRRQRQTDRQARKLNPVSCYRRLSRMSSTGQRLQ